MDHLIKPINNYTFGRGVQKGSNGMYRWWGCEEEGVIAPDFELAKMGPVKELTPAEAITKLLKNGNFNIVYFKYPQVQSEMRMFMF